MREPLEGVRILDITTMISGPWAAMILADQGADVIKIEMPEAGDHIRSLGNQSNGMAAMFLNVNRNKRSMTIDLKSVAGVDVLKALVRSADVLIQNFRPGVVERLGIAEADMRAVNPDLIYVSISGFGDNGPLSHKPVYDPIIQAVSGITTVQAGSDDVRPNLVRTILPDKLAGVTAAQAIAAALYSREKSGAGQHIKLNMLDAMLAFLWASDMGSQTFVDRPTSTQAAASFVDLIYRTKDGYMTISIMSNKEWRALSEALDKPEWLDDERFKTPALRDANINERIATVQAAIGDLTTDTLLARFEPLGVPCAPALTRSQIVKHPQLAVNETLVELDHPVAGRLRQARRAAQFVGCPPQYRYGAPRLGEHNWEILSELGYTACEVDELVQSGAVGSECALPPSRAAS